MKLTLGLAIILLVYNFVNIYEDRVVAIGLGFLGMFIFFWGLSFFLFLGGQNLFRRVSKERIIKDSYKLSLLFGIYAMINILLIWIGWRNKIVGIILLVGFIALQILLFSVPSREPTT